MDLFKKISTAGNYSTEVEWRVLKKVPLVLLLGTLLIATPILATYFNGSSWVATQTQTSYALIGLLFTFWFFTGTVAIGCVIMMVMKGPGYVADAYDIPEDIGISDVDAFKER